MQTLWGDIRLIDFGPFLLSLQVGESTFISLADVFYLIHEGWKICEWVFSLQRIGKYYERQKRHFPIGKWKYFACKPPVENCQLLLQCFNAGETKGFVLLVWHENQNVLAVHCIWCTEKLLSPSLCQTICCLFWTKPFKLLISSDRDLFNLDFSLNQEVISCSKAIKNNSAICFFLVLWVWSFTLTEIR